METNILTQKKQELAAVEAKLARLRTSETNPAGDIGGIRSWSRKRREGNIERAITNASKSIPLWGKRKSLLQDIAILESGKELPKPVTGPSRESMAKYALKVFEKVQVGDLVDIGGNSPIRVAKKNRASIIDECGEKWTFRDLYGCDIKDAA